MTQPIGTNTIRVDDTFPKETNLDDTLASYKSHLQNGGVIIFEKNKSWSIAHKCIKLKEQKFKELELNEIEVIHLTYITYNPKFKFVPEISFDKLSNSLGKERYGCICGFYQQIKGKNIECLNFKSYAHSIREDRFY